nr:MAG TPA: hypothetical protein [Caudoviricetes sp.]
MLSFTKATSDTSFLLQYVFTTSPLSFCIQGLSVLLLTPIHALFIMEPAARCLTADAGSRILGIPPKPI